VTTELLWQLVNYLSRFRLKFHQGFHPKPVTEGISFLGFRVFPQRRRLKQRKGIQYQQRLKKLIKQFEQSEILADTLVDSVMAWNNCFLWQYTGVAQSIVFIFT
jgi:hypothetical protein